MVTRRRFYKLIPLPNLWTFTSILMFAFAYPTLSFGWVFGLICIVPFLTGLDGKTLKNTLIQAIWLQIFVALIWYSWIPFTAAKIWDKGPAYILVTYLLVIPFFSSHITLYAIGRHYIFKYIPNIFIAVFISAIAFAIGEDLVSFQNMTLPNFLYQQPRLLSLASLGGMYFITFGIVFVSDLSAQLYRKKYHTLWVISPVAVFILFSLTYSLFFPNKISDQKVRVATTQTLHTPEEWRDQMPVGLITYASYNKVFSLVKNVIEKNKDADIFIMPEMIVPYYLFFSAKEEIVNKRLEFEKILTQSSKVLFIGNIGLIADGVKNEFMVITPDGNQLKIEKFDKTKPVPFAEVVPGYHEYSWLRPYLPRPRLATVGSQTISGSTRGINWGGLLCNEAVYPKIINSHRASGAKIEVVLGSQSTLNGTIAISVLTSYSILRAIESGLPIVKSSDTSGTAFIDVNGNVLQQIPNEKEGTLVGDIYLASDELNIFSRYPEWFNISSWALLIATLLYIFYRRFVRRV